MSQNEKENLIESAEKVTPETPAEATEAENKAEEKEAEPSVQKNAPKRKKKLPVLLCVSIILVFAIISFVIGIIVADVPILEIFSKTKTYTADELNIVLPKDFTAISGRDDLVACYSSNDVSIYIKKEAITEDSYLEMYDLDNYRLNILHENGMKYEELKNIEGNPYFMYDYLHEASGVTYTFFTFAYKTDDAFWMVQFATEKENVAEFEADIIQWADSVTFTEQAESK